MPEQPQAKITFCWLGNTGSVVLSRSRRCGNVDQSGGRSVRCRCPGGEGGISVEARSEPLDCPFLDQSFDRLIPPISHCVDLPLTSLIFNEANGVKLVDCILPPRNGTSVFGVVEALTRNHNIRAA
jgi:hypothetical protein